MGGGRRVRQHAAHRHRPSSAGRVIKVAGDDEPWRGCFVVVVRSDDGGHTTR